MIQNSRTNRGIRFVTRTPVLPTIATEFYRVDYTNEKFILNPKGAVFRCLVYSDDGLNWDYENTVGDDTYMNRNTKIVYGNGVYVAVALGALGETYYSLDGIHWTETQIPINNYVKDIAYGNGVFVMTEGVNGSGDIAYSFDGISWTAVSNYSLDQPGSIAFGNGKFVTVSSEDRASCMYSSDGISWVRATLPFTLSGRLKMMTGIVYEDGKFVALSSEGHICHSVDGTSWELSTTLSGADRWTKLYSGNGVFIAIGTKNDIIGSYAVCSLDCITWTPITFPSNIEMFKSIAYGDGKFVAVINDYSGIAYSFDGAHWSTELRMLLDQNGNDITQEVAECLAQYL